MRERHDFLSQTCKILLLYFLAMVNTVFWEHNFTSDNCFRELEICLFSKFSVCGPADIWVCGGGGYLPYFLSKNVYIILTIEDVCKLVKELLLLQNGANLNFLSLVLKTAKVF